MHENSDTNWRLRKFDAVLFDLGSTLIYFDGDWMQIVAEADRQLVNYLSQQGINFNVERFLIEFRKQIEAYYVERDTEFIEYTTAYIVQQLLDAHGYSNVSDDLIQEALAKMYAISQGYWRVEADAIPALKNLRERGYRLGMISNAGNDQDVQTLIDQAGLRSYFDVIVSSAALGIRKPNPRIFLMVAEQMEVEPRRCVMVGDRLGADVLGAHNAGMASVLITRRADTAANRAHLDTILPDWTVSALSEMPDVWELSPESGA